MIQLPDSIVRLTADLRAQVETDRAVGIGTLQDRYGLPRSTMRAAIRQHDLHITPVNLEAVRGRRSTDGTYLIVHGRCRPPSHIHTQLAHDAGMACIRLIVAAPPHQWRLAGKVAHPADPSDPRSRPDAYWLVAIDDHRNAEYDRGTYSDEALDRKIMASLTANRVFVFGSPSPRRLEKVRRRYEAIQAELAAERQRNYGFLTARRIDIILIPVLWHVGSER